MVEECPFCGEVVSENWLGHHLESCEEALRNTYK